MCAPTVPWDALRIASNGLHARIDRHGCVEWGDARIKPCIGLWGACIDTAAHIWRTAQCPAALLGEIACIGSFSAGAIGSRNHIFGAVD